MIKEQRVHETALKLKLKLQDALMKVYNGKHLSGLPKYKYLNVDDFADMIAYCDAILNSEYSKAFKLQRYMDSELSEKIPTHLYNFIHDNCIKVVYE